MRELVMVIPDLFLAPAAQEASGFAGLAALESMARCGERAPLAQGWRSWVAERLGRTDLIPVARARVAAACLRNWRAPSTGACWIATPVHLSAGLTRVHLHHAGLLQLAAPELTEVATAFARTLGADGSTLMPLPSGDFLLATPGIAAVATSEPARLAGGMLSQVLPETLEAAPLRRFMAECEMWLHGEALNAARARRGLPALTALWPWGAAGAIAVPERQAAGALPAGFGRDAWLEGLWQLCGAQCRELPPDLAQVLGPGAERGALLVLRVAAELQDGADQPLGRALERLDARFIAPALRALAAGELTAVTLVLNDHRVRVRVRRSSRLRFWRRRRPGLSAFV